MENTDQLVNKVEQSGLVTLDLAEFFPSAPIEIIDLKQYLVQGLVLMEKPFREALKATDWSQFNDKTVGITCTTDAIIPLWAYMLLTTYLQPHAATVYYGNKEQVEEQLLADAIAAIDEKKYKDAKVVIKGCGERSIPAAAFIGITRKLRPVVRSLMYGEPCSTVPIYKNALTKT